MNVNVTQICAIAALSMASLFAAGGNKKSSGSCDAISNVYGTMGCETATGRPQIERCGCNNWYIKAGVIYWHARIDGSEFAYSNETKVSTRPVHGSMKDVRYSWDWGFRVGLGYAFEHDNWDANLTFTYFDSSGSKSSSAGCNDMMLQNRAEFGITGSGTAFVGSRVVKAKSDVDYYNLDLEIGRSQFNTKYFYIRTHFGVKGAWTDLTQTSRFDEEYIEHNGSLTFNCANYVHVKDIQSWWGIGPRVGFDTKWFLGNKFNLFCDSSFAALFGLFDVRRSTKYSRFFPDTDLKVRANKHGITPYASIIIGAAYDTYVGANNGSHISVRFGYEVNYLWRHNQLLRVEDSLTNGQKFGRHSEDVAFNGLTADVKWEF